MNPEGKAIKLINGGKPYYGLVNILDSPYLTCYKPIKENSGNIAGIWYAGYKLSKLDNIGKIIGESKILVNGFVALLDNNDNIVYKSDNTETSVITNIIKTGSSEWITSSKSFTPWNYTILVAYPKTDIDDLLAESTQTLILAGAIVSLFLLLIVYLIVNRSVIKPLCSLTDTSEIIVNGNLNVEFKISSQDEFSLLANDFNLMVANLRETIKESETKSL